MTYFFTVILMILRYWNSYKILLPHILQMLRSGFHLLQLCKPVTSSCNGKGNWPDQNNAYNKCWSMNSSNWFENNRRPDWFLDLECCQLSLICHGHPLMSQGWFHHVCGYHSHSLESKESCFANRNPCILPTNSLANDDAIKSHNIQNQLILHSINSLNFKFSN